MAVMNPPGYLHNATPAVANAQMDRLIGINSGVASNGSGVASLEGARGVNDLIVSAQATPNMTVSVSSGIAVVNGTQNATQGSYVFLNDGAVSLTISAANATNPRRDLIIARIYDSQYSGSSNTSALEVVTGTASATPTDPPMPANSIALAKINVAAAATSITAGMVEDLRDFYAAPGGIIPVRNATRRNALVKYDGLTVYRLDTHVLETWNSSAAGWNSQSSSSGTTGITAATGWSINSQTWVVKAGVFSFYFVASRTGGNITAGSDGNMTNQLVATIPAGQRPVVEQPVDSGRTGRMIGGTCDTAGNLRLTTTVPSANINTGDNLSFSGSWVI